MKAETGRPRKEKGVDQHDFLVAWSTGMNDFEIAQHLGVSPETVRQVKADLFGDGAGDGER